MATDLRRGLVMDVNPFVVGFAEGSDQPAGWGYDRSVEAGANVRWGVTANLSLNGTVNPDFSQVESDASQVVTDPRQALLFPEKRPFFLESLEQFATPNTLIYTRRIVAPVGAAKLTWKVSGTNVASILAFDDPVTSATAAGIRSSRSPVSGATWASSRSSGWSTPGGSTASTPTRSGARTRASSPGPGR